MKRFSLILLCLTFMVLSMSAEELYHWTNEITYISPEACSLVYVDVCVFDEEGRYVKGLDLSNFTFIEEEDTVRFPRLTQLSFCPPETTMIDMVMFFDLSTSMNDEILTLGDNITAFISALSPDIDFRLAYWTFNGCPAEVTYPAEGVRELFRTDLSSTSCVYSETSTDIWATNASQAQCLFDAGFDYFYSLPGALRGSGYEDQYGAMAHAADTMTFRDGARVIFFLFTDERPIYNSTYCVSWGPSDDDLYDFIRVI